MTVEVMGKGWGWSLWEIHYGHW